MRRRLICWQRGFVGGGDESRRLSFLGPTQTTIFFVWVFPAMAVSLSAFVLLALFRLAVYSVLGCFMLRVSVSDLIPTHTE